MAQPYKKDQEVTVRHKVTSRWKRKTNELKWKSDRNWKTNDFVQRLIFKIIWISIVKKERDVNTKEKSKITIDIAINIEIIKQVVNKEHKNDISQA